jgi:DNA polymerase I
VPGCLHTAIIDTPHFRKTRNALPHADGFKIALSLISRRLEGVDARIVHTQQDEIIVEVRDGIEDQVQAIVKESMEEAFKQIIPEVPFLMEIRVAEAWG